MTAKTTGSKEKTDDYVILRIVGGPAAGREIPIKSDKVSVGRAISADISIPDTVLSRTHIIIYREGVRWKIKDLGSTNGTWIKGKRVKGNIDVPLKTPVQIGNTLFELAIPTLVEEPTEFDETLISARVSPITVHSLTQTSDATALVKREQQKLTAIYKVQSLLSSVHEETELYHQILDVVFEVIPSDSSYLMIYMPEEDTLIPMASRNQKGRADISSENYISKSIVNFVKQKNESILSVDAPNDDRFQSMSLCGFNVHSVMCVPMIGKTQLCGLLYLSSMKSTMDYKEEDLRLLTIVAHSAGMAIDNSQLVKQNLRAERMAAIGTTAAGMSHYIKNILTGLEGSVSLLRLGIDSIDKDLMNQAWQILSKNHKRMSTLVLDLLNLSKDDSSNITMCNMANIVIEIVELIQTRVFEDRIKIITDEELRSSEYFAEIDSRGIHRVLLNLLNNATYAVKEKHGNSGDGRIEIRLSMEKQGTILTIKVKDNGIGIPIERQAEVFEMFNTSKGDQGMGLGLAVSKRIIENHNGKISIVSDENEGAEFITKIPTQQQKSSI